MTGDGNAFDQAAAEIEARTGLDGLAARGTLRIALRSAGLDPKTATAGQFAVAVERVLPAELTSRGVERAAEICRALAQMLRERGAGRSAALDPSSPEQVFRRMRQGGTTIA